ncbi:unnamed protein product [Staurois parvus]|uniref:Uncharacterized protein n=1 Tax=Staurois parvus TaxID=386267 RepID=A0ABN9F0T9_9NEOB|nr:unnamed protein product [Staurois parvus]
MTRDCRQYRDDQERPADRDDQRLRTAGDDRDCRQYRR